MMPKHESLGDRMKFYERHFGSNLTYLMPLVPAVIRLDGRAFHTFTRGLDRPFDRGMTDLMDRTTRYLVEETNACIGYTQSDEITLVLYAESHNSQIHLDGKVDKLNSLLASAASLYFASHLEDYIPSKAGQRPQFDCRCFSVPNKAEAVNALVWREQDATRNSIQMLGQANFSHARLQNKSCDEIQELLFSEKGINWNDTRDRDKRGGYFQRRHIERAFTAEELSNLPERHEARSNPDLVITRREIAAVEMPILTKVINQSDVVFNGAEPEVECNQDGLNPTIGRRLSGI